MAGATDAGYQVCKEYAEGESCPLTALDSPQDFYRTMPQGVLQGLFPHWRGFWRKTDAS